LSEEACYCRRHIRKIGNNVKLSTLIYENSMACFRMVCNSHINKLCACPIFTISV